MYVTVGCPSVRLSASGFAAVGQAGRRYISIAAWLAAANAGSVTLSAAVGG